MNDDPSSPPEATAPVGGGLAGMPSGTRFRVVAPGGIEQRRWNDGDVVFHEASGDTLFLDPVSALFLDALGDGQWHTLDSLCMAVDASLEPAIAERYALRRHADALLPRLDRLAMLEVETA